MRRFALTILLLLIALNAFAENDDIRLRVKDANDDTKMISGKLLDIDFNGWRLHIEISQNETIWINFIDIDVKSSTTIFKLLSDKASNDPSKLFESARYMLFINRINSAENLFDKALKAGLADERKIKDFESQVNEFYGQELIKEIQTKIVEGDFKDARKLLSNLKESKYQETQAYKRIDILENQLERAEESTKEIDPDKSKNIEKKFADLIAGYEKQLALGHKIYFDTLRGVKCTDEWNEIIKIMDLDNSKGLIVALKEYEEEQPEGMLRNRITKMREKATEILICAYKSIISYYLERSTIESFKVAYEYLRKAVVVAPLDREIIYYWYLYDEYKQYIKTESKTDKNDEEEDRN